jgi:hypothetical protein
MTLDDQYRAALKKRNQLSERLEKLRQEGESVEIELHMATHLCNELREKMDSELSQTKE